jgi:REP element-mobilizing transposase RayT
MATSIRNTWRRQHRDSDYILHCATIMPDHIHWLCTLGARLTLAQTISKFKSLAEIRQDWQRNYYDHRLRSDDAKEPFAKYIFLNPYRKNLLAHDQEWPWWTLNRNERPEFTIHLNEGKYPPPEWLEHQINLQTLIARDSDDGEPYPP